MERRIDLGYLDETIDQKIEEKIDALDEVIDQRIDEKIDEYKPLAELDPLIVFGLKDFQTTPFIDQPITIVDPFITNQINTLAKHINFVFHTNDSGHIRTQSFPIRAYGKESSGIILVEQDQETGRYSFENNFVPQEQQFLLRTFSVDGEQEYVKKIILLKEAYNRFKIVPDNEYSINIITGQMDFSDKFVVQQIYFTY